MKSAQDGGGARQGTGLINLTLTGTTLTLVGSFSGLSAPSTAAHIHGPSGPFPATAGVIYGLGGTAIPLGVTAGSINGSVTLADIGTYTLSQQLADLNSSKWYVNIHDSVFPGGEIRGAIVPVPEPSTWALMGFSALGLVWSLRRKKA